MPDPTGQLDAPKAADQDQDQVPPPDSDDPLANEPDLQDELRSLYTKVCGEDRYPRLIEVKDVKQAENYWAGRQYEWWSESDQAWKPLTSPTGGVSQGTNFNVDDMPRYMYVTNIYQATGLTVIGAVAGAPPRIRFFPNDATNDDDLRTAEGRTKLAKLIQRWNPPQLLLQEETYHAWTGGFICWWTRYVSDGDKYGFDPASLLESSEEQVESSITCPECGWSAPATEAEPPIPCPQCGTELTEENIGEEEPIPVPSEGETQEVPKGREIISIYGALNCKRPQHTKEQSQWHYFAIEDEVHYSILRGAYPDKAGLIKPGLNFGADDAFERNARLSLAENTKTPTQTAGALANLVTFARVWFRPSAFWIIEDEDKRKKLQNLFPRGCRVEFAGNTYCASAAESMDDAIKTTHAMPGRGQHRPGIGTSLISVQDRFNTLANISMETYEYGIPITYRAADTFASEADDEQRAAPGLEVEVALQPGQDLRQKIFQVRADSTSPDMQKHMADLFGPTTQYLSGAFPALTGSSQAGEQPETLGQQSMQRDQAMGRMGVFYVNLKQAHADVLTIACRDFEAHTDGEVKIPVFGPSGDFESESVDVNALEGEAEAYPEGDENFPELWNQQRATMMQISDSSYGPELMKEPENAELMGKLTGIPDLKIPGIDARRKQLREISEMAKVPEGDDLLGPIAPMVEVDPETDDHVTEAQTCKSWLNSEAGQKTKRDNPAGWMLVKQHMLQHQAAMPKPEPATKPLSPTVTTAFKDMPPEAQAQWLEKEFGIKVSPQDFLNQIALEKAKHPPKPAPTLVTEGNPNATQTA